MHLRVSVSAGQVMFIIKVLFTAFVLWTVLVLPQIVNNAISALPHPLPQIIGLAMFVAVVGGFIALLNRLLKGTE